jgi:hypothetical protein
MILSLVAKDELAPSTKDLSGDPLGKVAPYTGVSPEWQIFFEKFTFRHFTPTTSALRKFDHLTSGDNDYRRYYVRDISFTVQLPAYSCRRCHEPEDSPEIVQNNSVFTKSMKALLGALSTWAPNGGLTLELNIKSSGDTEHVFHSSEMEDNFPFKHWNWRERLDFIPTYMVENFARRPQQHWWADDRDGYRTRSARHGALERCLGSLLEFTDDRLPRVEAVTSLLQRHQFKRQLSPFALRTLMQKSLVQLSSFRLERWCRPSVRRDEKYLKDFKEHVVPHLPKSLETFHYYAERYMHFNRSTAGAVKPLSIVETLNTHGLRLKQISVVEPYDATFSIEDMMSIAAISPSKPIEATGWENLERVCFKSSLLDWERRDMGPANDLFVLSASMAERLPKLLGWEIYNNDCLLYPLQTCLFRYSIRRSAVASISWENW